MNRARRRAVSLRKRGSGYAGGWTQKEVANALGLEVWLRNFAGAEGDADQTATSRWRGGSSPEWRRWVTAHAIAHRLMHPGNHLEHAQAHTDLPLPWEREAEEFAHALLVDEDEALAEGFVYAWEVAEHFGVPPELVRVQARLLPGQCE